MSTYSKTNLRRLISIGAVAFSLAELICLAMIFVGCTSPFSPFNLYFMKIDLHDFPHIERSQICRFPDIAAVSRIRSLGGVQFGSRSSDEDARRDVASAAIEISELASFLEGIGPALPEYYHVGLLSYCEGQKGIINSCTSPMVSFSFSFWGTRQSLATSINKSFSQDSNAYLTGNPRISHAIVALYISAFVTAFVTSILSISLIFIPGQTIFTLLFSTINTILTVIATSWAISFYDFYTQRIEQALGQYGASASLGTHTIASTCMAVLFSVGSVSMNIWRTHA